jgi:hypothetical protein
MKWLEATDENCCVVGVHCKTPLPKTETHRFDGLFISRKLNDVNLFYAPIADKSEERVFGDSIVDGLVERAMHNAKLDVMTTIHSVFVARRRSD